MPGARAIAIALLLFAPPVAAAQQTERERRAADVGTATLAVQVLDAARTPLGSVRIRLRRVPEQILVKDAMTDADGRVTFTQLRSGGYRVLLARGAAEAYLGSYFLAVGEQKTQAFQKGPILSGRVVNERGAPVPGMPVCALRYQADGAPSRARPIDAYTTTELDGTFVIHDHKAAARPEYLLVARPDGCALGVQRPAARLMHVAPAYYPDAIDPADAGVIAVGPSDDKDDLVIRTSAATTTRIEGRVFGFENPSVVPARVILEPAPGAVSIVRTATVDPDGRFTFYGVRPGQYTMIVPPRTDKTTAQMYALDTIEITGQAIVPVAMKMLPALFISGNVTFDGREQPYFGVSVRSSVTAVPEYPRSDVNELLPQQYATFDERSRFAITGLLPTSYRLTTQGFQTLGWVPVDAIARRTPGGLPLPNAFRTPIALEPGGGLFEMQLRFTVGAVIEGTVQQPDGTPVRNVWLEVFPADDRSAVRGTTLISIAPDEAGHFVSPPLPAGVYLVAARSARAPAGRPAPGPEDLEVGAARVTVKPGERAAVTLTVK